MRGKRANGLGEGNERVKRRGGRERRKGWSEEEHLNAQKQ